MRKPKPRGNHKHNADKCGVCAKPKKYRKQQLSKAERNKK